VLLPGILLLLLLAIPTLLLLVLAISPLTLLRSSP
jgi:hypothetical protein